MLKHTLIAACMALTCSGVLAQVATRGIGLTDAINAGINAERMRKHDERLRIQDENEAVDRARMLKRQAIEDAESDAQRHAITYVKPYITRNGTFVEGHFRSAPDGARSNNYSAQGNVNPYSGAKGTVDPFAPQPLFRPAPIYPAPAYPSLYEPSR